MTPQAVKNVTKIAKAVYYLITYAQIVPLDRCSLVMAVAKPNAPKAITHTLILSM